MSGSSRFDASTRRARPWRAAGLVVLTVGAVLVVAPATGAGPGPLGGTNVTVTREMQGAGVVSSGVTLPPIPKLAGDHSKPVPAWEGPLPYPIVIADRRNNRLIEVAPNKEIVWEFPSPNLKIYRGNAGMTRRTT